MRFRAGACGRAKLNSSEMQALRRLTLAESSGPTPNV
jgi:hypothetical protein